MEPELESFGLWLENWFGKIKKEGDEMSRGYRRMNTSPLNESTKRYKATNSQLKGIHQRD